MLDCNFEMFTTLPRQLRHPRHNAPRHPPVGGGPRPHARPQPGAAGATAHEATGR